MSSKKAKSKSKYPDPRKSVDVRQAVKKAWPDGVSKPTPRNKPEDFMVAHKPAESESDAELKKYVDHATRLTKDPVTGRNDAFVELLKEWTPVILPFVQGFLQSASQARQQAAPQQAIAPPPGWLGMGALQKLSRKHTNPAWYTQGVAYDAAMSGQPVQQETYAPAPSRRPQAPPVQEAEFTDRSNELPLVDMNAKPQETTMIPQDQQQQQAPQAPTPQQQADAMLDLLLSRLGQTDPKTVVAKAKEDAGELTRTAESYKDFVAPVILKAMLARPWASPQHDGMVDLVEKRCPAQHKALDDEALLPKLGDIYEEQRKKAGVE